MDELVFFLSPGSASAWSRDKALLLARTDVPGGRTYNGSKIDWARYISMKDHSCSNRATIEE